MTIDNGVVAVTNYSEYPTVAIIFNKCQTDKLNDRRRDDGIT